MLFRMIVGSAAIFLSSLSASAADPIGIPVCDAFLDKFQACVANRVAADSRANYQAAVDSMRNNLFKYKKFLNQKQLEDVCKLLPDKMRQKTPIGSIDCTRD